MSEPKTSPMSRPGYNRIEREHAHLWKVVRPEVVQRISDAAAEGDRSENAEYIYGRKRLRELDRRIRYLSNLLKHARIVDIAQQSGDVVVFGATVELEAEDSRHVCWTIVGEGEADPNHGTISFRAPLAAALLGKSAGDEVRVPLPDGEAWYEILEVYFDPTRAAWDLP